jgi:hypothetical protein
MESSGCESGRFPATMNFRAAGRTDLERMGPTIDSFGVKRQLHQSFRLNGE